MFKQSLKEFFASKTNWAALAMIVGGLIGIYQKADLKISAESVVAGLALIFTRDAIAGIK